MSYGYNAKFTPPFPVLPVKLRQVEGGGSTKILDALLDTGADFTLAPWAILKRLQAKMLYPMQVRSHWGELTAVHVYSVDLEVAGELLPSVDIVADRQGKDVILGRNVLNKLILLVDGLHLKTDVLTRRPLRF